MNTVQGKNCRNNGLRLNLTLSDYRAEDNCNVPKYELLKRLLIDYISALPPEQEFLPYEKDLMKQFNVCRSTVSRAMSKLRRGGYIETARKRGSRIIRRNPGEGQHPLLAKPVDSVGFLLANTEDYSQRSSDIRWQLVDEFERMLLLLNIRLFVYDLRENEWQAWKDPEKLSASLKANGISWVVMRPYRNDNSPLENLINHLQREKIKIVLSFLDMSDLASYSALLSTGIDYIVVNNLSTIRQALDQHFMNADFIAYIDNDSHCSWSQFRAGAFRDFAQTNNIHFEHISSAYMKLDDNDFRNNIINIDKESVEKFLKLAKSFVSPVCFASNDYSAACIIRRMEQLGVERQRFIIVGHDNMASERGYNLPTFDFNNSGQANGLVELLNEYMNNPNNSLACSKGITVPASFVDRIKKSEIRNEL